ncbi:hypothetical protein LPJ53_002148 [Coemansia erecta]|uniref:Amino acid transporter transmembrane domain-containing protein n=1 Tax=Coemansia erecta TaxID=147472 RepID=A0A9W8CTB2_9FUNG|nr:hypothetical protein LPJ53_002148 [Coemansia erecta]
MDTNSSLQAVEAMRDRNIDETGLVQTEAETEAEAENAGGESTTKVGFNILNTIIGSGIVCLPYALHNAGFFFGVIMLAFIALLSQFSLYALVVSGKRTGTAHFSSVTQASLGQTGYHLLNVSMVIDMVGTVILYLMLVGDLATSLSDIYLPVALSRSSIIMIVSMVCVLPLLFFRNTGPLANFSILSVLCLPYIILVVAIRAPLYADRAQVDFSFFGPRVLPAMGVLAFTYSSCHAAFPNFLGLKDRSVRSWVRASSSASAGAGLISTAFAITGYLSFGGKADANILNNFPASDNYINLGRLLFAATLILTVPMAFYPIRDTLTEMLHIDPERHITSRVPESICTVVVFVSCALAAAACTDLGLAYEIIGALSSSVVNFLLPSLIYLWAGTDVSLKAIVRGYWTPEDPLDLSLPETLPLLLKDTSKTVFSVRQIGLWLMAWTVAGFGVWVMVLGTYNIGRGL